MPTAHPHAYAYAYAHNVNGDEMCFDHTKWHQWENFIVKIFAWTICMEIN